MTWKKETILRDIQKILHISEDRHHLEIKRARENPALKDLAKYNTKILVDSSDSDSDSDKGRSAKRRKLDHWGEIAQTEFYPPLKVVPVPASLINPPNLAGLPRLVLNEPKPKRQTNKNKKVERKSPAKKRNDPATSDDKNKAENGDALVVDPIVELDPSRLQDYDPDDLAVVESKLRARQDELRAQLAALNVEGEESDDEAKDEEDPEENDSGDSKPMETDETPTTTTKPTESPAAEDKDKENKDEEKKETPEPTESIEETKETKGEEEEKAGEKETD
eukprot:TRINITY_DN3371_c0_g2_i1.p1 TRINITY_DN3371_c0_g2~~TRINITY_DN3371_c0_g2_i1.p1  ORF type:complete len:279 (+),score=93.04 TRINITY_DN3371_c0_g2_i1:178-1014(+)